MSDNGSKGVPWPVWAFVTLAVAAIPLLANSGKGGAGNPQPAPAALVNPVVQSPPLLTHGTWTIEKAVDHSGLDWSNSTLKFLSQRVTSVGLEVEGVFEWRTGTLLHGREHFTGVLDMPTRQLTLEGIGIEIVDGALVPASYTAVLSADGRRLTDGTWGSVMGTQPGTPGAWEAFR